MEKSVNEVVSLVEKREMAHDAHVVAGNASAISSRQVRYSFSPHRNPNPPPGLKAPSASPFSKSILCPQCGEQFSPFSEGSRGWNNKPHEV